MKKFRIGRPSPAMIVAIVALVLAMVGTGYAAVNLPKKSVGTAQLKGSAVTNAKIKNGTITGKKLNLKKLGVVPNATHASSADIATTVPPNAVHVIGAAGEPGFQGGTTNYGTESGLTLPGASFLKDHDNVVHLEGVVKTGSGGTLGGEIFQLPPGYRPPSGQIVVLEASGRTIIIAGSNVSIGGFDISGEVIGEEEEAVILTGVSFFAGS
ncbi:MAG TPA: hypothetical protein VFX44_04145 [Solirubrobacterales bacterium]|nr:hypothetical protein [Solirubrobacterales bacterium]